jgi:argininosuccinate lyase
MLVTFQSTADADITMYESHIGPILESLGKNAKRGVITVPELAQFITAFEKIMEEDRKQRAQVEEIDEDELDDIERKKRKDFVSTSARLFPLYEMLKAANKKQKEVIWGV